MLSVHYLAALAAFAASATWAFASERYAEAARTAGTVRVNLLRALSATLLWLLALICTGGLSSLGEVSGQSALLLAGSTACSYALGDGIFFVAAARLGVSAALAIATTYPLWAALYGALLHGEPFGPLRACGLLLCLAGVSALLALTRGAARDAAARRAAALGVALALLASLCWAGNAVLLKQGAQGVSLYQANVLRFAAAALLLAAQLPFASARAAAGPSAPPLRFAQLARQLALPLLIDTGLGSVCYVYGIANSDLAVGATLSSLSPLVALPQAALRGSERITASRALAVAVTVLGVVLLVLAPK